MNLYDEDDEPQPRPAPIIGIVLLVLAVLAFVAAPLLGAEEFPAGVYPGQKPVAAKPVKHVAGLHSHKCPYDGTEWWHGEDQFGKSASHACPKCGRIVWEVAQQAPKAVAIAPKAAVSNCPNGQCPLPTRRGRR